MFDIILGDVVAILCNNATVCFCLECGWLLNSSTENRVKDLSRLNISKRAQGRDKKLFIRFCEMIHLHTDVKKLCEMTLTVRFSHI